MSAYNQWVCGQDDKSETPVEHEGNNERRDANIELVLSTSSASPGKYGKSTKKLDDPSSAMFKITTSAMLPKQFTINKESDDEIIRDMVIPMKEKFDKYWEEVSDLFAMTAVFDPRLKLPVVEYCSGRLDMSTRDAKMKNLRLKLETLFESYDKKSKSTSPSAEPREMDQQNVCGGPKGTFENYGDFFAFRKSSVAASGKTALQAYLDEPALDMDSFESLDILNWWKDNTHRFGDLPAMACDLLSIPITTVASESSFSIGSRVLNKYRSCLLPKNVQALICSRNWLKGFEASEHENEIVGEDETVPWSDDEVEEEET